MANRAPDKAMPATVAGWARQRPADSAHGRLLGVDPARVRALARVIALARVRALARVIALARAIAPERADQYRRQQHPERADQAATDPGHGDPGDRGGGAGPQVAEPRPAGHHHDEHALH